MPVLFVVKHPRSNQLEEHHIPRITVDTRQSDNLTTMILKLGLALEDHYCAGGSDTAVLVWSYYDMLGADAIIDKLPNFRADEIMFPTLNMESHVGWAAGHAKALIRWAATCRHAALTDITTWPQSRSLASGTANLVWWAQRINLQVYGLHS